MIDDNPPVVHCEECNRAYETIVNDLIDHTEYECPVCGNVVWKEEYGNHLPPLPARRH